VFCEAKCIEWFRACRARPEYRRVVLKNYMIKKLVFLLPFISFLAGYFIIQLLFSADQQATPNIIGKSLQESCELLSEQNLNIRILGRKEDPDLPPHTIVSQTPQPNDKIKPHQSVYVVITAQAATNHTPALVGKSLDSIKEELEKLNLKSTAYLVPSPYPTGTCIAQLPRPGELISKNNITTYCAAENKKPIIWPNFKGKSLGAVKELLETVNITPQIIPQRSFIKTISPHHSEFTDSSMVIDQRPRAGTLLHLDANKPITVQLSVE
jgi:beta-lactam-binding protein with PASTA domain